MDGAEQREERMSRKPCWGDERGLSWGWGDEGEGVGERRLVVTKFSKISRSEMLGEDVRWSRRAKMYWVQRKLQGRGGGVDELELQRRYFKCITLINNFFLPSSLVAKDAVREEKRGHIV